MGLMGSGVWRLCMWGVKKDKDLKLALIGKSGVVGFVLWVWLFRYAFFFWPAFLGLFRVFGL